MADFVLVNNDIVLFLPMFPPAIVVPIPGTITASGKNNATKKIACVDGDEKTVQVMGCPYISGPYCIPGVGTLKIESLAADQKAKKTNSGGKPILLKGTLFNAVFEVMSPAKMPPPPSTPDATPKYSGGKGMFINSNMTVKAS